MRILNVYRDLDYPDADLMLAKAQLTAGISQVISMRGLTRAQASARLKISEASLSRFLRGEFRGVSEWQLLRWLALLGSDVEIILRRPKRTRKPGTVTVRFA
jgi:predicted XRE-type DNA-binding protein